MNGFMETRRNKGLTDFLQRLSVAAVLLLSLLPASASAQYQMKGGDITSGLIAHWKLNESTGSTATDSVGTYTGTLVNSPAWEPNDGKIGGDLDFNGSNTEVTVADNNNLDWGTGEPPPIKESSLDSDYAIRFGNFMGVIFDGEKNAYDGADYRQAASG